MRVHARAALVASSVVALLCVAGFTDAAPTVDHGTRAVTDGSDTPTVLDALGRGSFGDVYGGLIGVDGGASIDVYLTTMSADVEEALQDSAGKVPVNFRLTPNSTKTVDDTDARVKLSSDELASRGIQVASFGPDVATGTVELDVVSPSPTDMSYLNDTFGSSQITIRSVDKSALTEFTQTANRTSDTPPFYPGDAINHHTNGGCTAGFGIITASGYHRMLTAGHCASTGDTMYVAGHCAATCPGGGITLGPIERNGYSDQIDAEIINTDASSYLWRGVPGSPYAAGVDGKLGNFTGYYICQSGAYNGETCNGYVDDVRRCYMVRQPNGAIVQMCGLNHAIFPGISSVGGGDSGGPVYRFSGGGLYAQGIVESGNSDGSQMLYTGIDAIFDEFDLSDVIHN